MQSKLSFFLIFVAFVQLCFGAAINSNESEDEIAELRALMYNMPQIKTEAIEPLLGVMSRFSNCNSSDEQSDIGVELVCLLLSSGTNNTLKKGECVNIFNSVGEKMGRNAEIDSMSSDLNNGDLAEFEEKLRQRLNAQQTEQIMKIMRKFHKDNAPSQFVEGTVDLVFYGLFNPSNKPENTALRHLFAQLVQAQIETDE